MDQQDVGTGAALRSRDDDRPDARERAAHSASWIAYRYGDDRERATDYAIARIPAAEMIARVLDTRTGNPAASGQQVDRTDVVAALCLVARMRDDTDRLERAILREARAIGMTWREIAHLIELDSSQAAQQRHDRLAARLDDATK